MSNTGNPPAEIRHRRTSMSKLRTAAAGSVLAAVSITGVGAAAGPAQASELRSFLTPLQGLGTAAAGAEDSGAAPRATPERRLLGIREDLANAVAWGSVTQAQADRFYAQMQSRIARGL
ncbi:hypothetical protein [Arthrobacter gengyunqii]|uniref:Uncharacterized protein n=1 Tax=Arthrobacter gengyunqii TaxID=2886940 RepID=A0ABS8GG06_9MICC|nr:hypothetical protein [Arthrobacter gengyunqii]MCC3265519.1 hypothetical protein [Arthrobacter gengyunqii]